MDTKDSWKGLPKTYASTGTRGRPTERLVLPWETLAEWGPQFPSGPVSREAPGHLLWGGVTFLSSPGMTQNSLDSEEMRWRSVWFPGLFLLGLLGPRLSAPI